MNITVAIPYYNRSDLIMETLDPLISDLRIDEILIVDDQSDQVEYVKMLDLVKNIKKIRVLRNVINFHVQHSKRNCISMAKNEWVVVLDNDNVMSSKFFDVLFQESWEKDTIYHPDFASPNFSYKNYSGKIFTKENISQFCNDEILMTLLNTNNYLVNKEMYLRVYEYNKDCRGSDGIVNNYNWLKFGNKIKIVKDLEYFHRVHPGSAFLAEADQNMIKINTMFEKVKSLK